MSVNVLLIVQLPKVPVTVYGVAIVGDSIGFSIDGLLTPDVGVQEYEVALLVKLGVKLAPLQIFVFACEDIVGVVTVAVKFRVAVQVPKVAVSTYGVVAVGDNVGFSTAGLLTPDVGDQEKVLALLVKLGINDAPEQMVVSALLLTDKLFVVPIVTF